MFPIFLAKKKKKVVQDFCTIIVKTKHVYKDSELVTWFFNKCVKPNTKGADSHQSCCFESLCLG